VIDMYNNNFGWKNALYEIIPHLCNQKGNISKNFDQILQLALKDTKDTDSKLIKNVVYPTLLMIQPVLPELCQMKYDKDLLSTYLDYLWQQYRQGDSSFAPPTIRPKVLDSYLKKSSRSKSSSSRSSSSRSSSSRSSSSRSSPTKSSSKSSSSRSSPTKSSSKSSSSRSSPTKPKCPSKSSSSRSSPSQRKSSSSVQEIWTKKECNQWLKNKSINPKTNKKISVDGRIYKKIQVNCSTSPSSTSYSPKKKQKETKEIKQDEGFTKKECQQWLKNKSVNPKTNRKISEDGKIYKKIEKQCKKY